MEAAAFSEILTTFFQNTRRHIPKNNNVYIHSLADLHIIISSFLSREWYMFSSLYFFWHLLRQGICYRAIMLPELDSQYFEIFKTRVRFRMPYGVVSTSYKCSSVEHWKGIYLFMICNDNDTVSNLDHTALNCILCSELQRMWEESVVA
jgi:hypothetical protein